MARHNDYIVLVSTKEGSGDSKPDVGYIENLFDVTNATRKDRTYYRKKSAAIADLDNQLHVAIDAIRNAEWHHIMLIEKVGNKEEKIVCYTIYDPNKKLHKKLHEEGLINLQLL